MSLRRRGAPLSWTLILNPPLGAPTVQDALSSPFPLTDSGLILSVAISARISLDKHFLPLRYTAQVSRAVLSGVAKQKWVFPLRLSSTVFRNNIPLLLALFFRLASFSR